MVNLDYLYNPEAAKPHFSKSFFSDKKLGFQVIENGMILSHKDIIVDGKWTWGKGGIVDNQGKFIKGSFVHRGVGGMYTPPPESIKHSSETVIYLGLFFPVWGHVITDDIKFTWFLNSEFMKEFKGCPVVYLGWENKNLENKNVIRLLKILGVDFDNLKLIKEPTQFERIILPDESFFLDKTDRIHKATNEYRETIDRVRSFALKNRTPTSCKKIYNYYGRNQVGEMRLAEYFKTKGYEIITHEERIKFDEYFNLLINCESFASNIGSCAHDSVFLRDGTETIMIPRSSNAFTGYQQAIDQASSLNANYVDSTLSVFNVRHDSFCYVISEQLKRFFGDKWNGYEEEDFKVFLDYVTSPTVRRGLAINPNEVRGYGAVFTDFMSQLKRRKDLIASYDMPPRWETFQSPLTYQTHVHMKGWRDEQKCENQFSNPLDQQLEVLAIIVNYPGHKVYYSVYYNEAEGWSEEVTNRQMAGTTGKTKPIYGMRLRLDEGDAKELNILYRMHKFDGTWTPWAKNGEALYSHGQKLNAIQIKLEFVKIQSETKDFDYQTFLLKDDKIYLQVQRQDLAQMKLEAKVDTQVDKKL